MEMSRYEVESEFSVASMENLMRIQLQGIDGIRDSLQDKRHELAKALDLVDSLEKERLALEKYISLIGEPHKMQDDLTISKAWAGMLETTLKKTLVNRMAETKEKEALKEEMEAPKLENE